ncbi:uncharacterized protein LOC144351913 [Saccoglossus kowalevskii]
MTFSGICMIQIREDKRSAAPRMKESGSHDTGKHLKAVTEDYGKNTTAHGVSHIFSATHPCTRFTWMAIVLLALVILVVQVGLLISQFLEYNVNVEMAVVSPNQLMFPSVTVCNTNKLRRSAIRDSIYSDLLVVDTNFVLPYYVPCMIGDFNCTNGIHCIKPYLVCDGIIHCEDKSDEHDCFFEECGEDEFHCDNGSERGTCIPSNLVCDKTLDCYDGQDEDNCDHRCILSLECISKVKTCDGEYDCRDGSDESNNVCEIPLMNIAPMALATMQSGTYANDTDPDQARDGDIDTCSVTYNTYQPYWTINFGSAALVHEVTITHNGDYIYASLTGAEIRVGGNNYFLNNELCAARLLPTQTSSLTFTVECDNPLYGRYLSIQVMESSQALILCEVEIMAVANALSNVAYGKPAEQSSQFKDGSAIKAVDGDTSSDYSHHSCMHTQFEYEPWWRVDTECECGIEYIVITNRQDCCSDRLIGAEVRIGNSRFLNESNTLCGTVTRANIEDVDIVINCGDTIVGRYVSIQIFNRTDYLHVCEVKAFGNVVAESLSNVALNKSAYISSVWYGNTADKAVDGNTYPVLNSGTCIHSAEESEPWWRVDLGGIYFVYKVAIYNRQDCCVPYCPLAAQRLAGAAVRVGYYEDAKRNHRCGQQIVPQISRRWRINRKCHVPILGRYVSIQLEGVGSGFLHICEVKVFADELVINPVEKIKQRALFAFFDKQQFKRLMSDSGKDKVYNDVSLETCLDNCYFQKTFVCKSFDYRQDVHECTIYSVDASDKNSSLMVDEHFNYYQRLVHGVFIASGNSSDCPSGMWQCGSGECLHTYRICDVINDCLDSSDEEDCTFKESGGYNPSCQMSSQKVLKSCVETGDIHPLGPFPFRLAALHNYMPPCQPFEHIHFCEYTLEIRGLEHKSLSTWMDVFKDVTRDVTVYQRFFQSFYQDSLFYRVKGEDPPDWSRFKTFSSTPDHSDLRQVLKLTEVEMSARAHQIEDFILQCTFASEKCGPSDFLTFQDDNYGNCFQFNAKSNDKIQWAMRPGSQYGLQLTLFTEQEEYLSIYGQDSGAKVTILPRGIVSFPVDEGITVKPGTITSIALRKGILYMKQKCTAKPLLEHRSRDFCGAFYAKDTDRQSWPYGNCTQGHIEPTVSGQQHNSSYSILSCQKACAENALIHYCGCAEYIFTDAPRCKLLNETQDLCRQLTRYLTNIGEINCKCPSPCKETKYDMTLSQSQWPSDVYLNKLLKALKWKNFKLKNVNDMQSARSNLVRLEIYFETLNYESVHEQPAYKWEDILSDIGGTMGLYIGISIISICEFVSFIVLLCWKLPKKEAVQPRVEEQEHLIPH